ncbi:MAG: C25 family cysteine peptidase [Chitinophagaceae bacterium]
MKKNLLLLLLLAGLYGQAQPYNNEWINYSRTYYKFKVGATGLYRIDQALLSSAGLGSTPAEQFQLWRNGQQLPIYTSVQTGPLSASDYIEFWGEMNDGKTDNALYRLSDYQLSDKYGSATDTASFFLTVNPGGTNLRLVPTASTLPSALPVEPYFMYTAGRYYRDRFNLGYAAVVGEYIYSSAYDQGEGYASSEIGAGGTLTNSFAGLNPYLGPGAPAPGIRVHAVGTTLDPRQFVVKVNGSTVATQTMDYFDYAKLNAPLTTADISSGTGTVEITNNTGRMVVAKTELTYAREFNFGGANNFLFDLPANAAGNYLEIAGFNNSGVPPVLYDFTNGKRYVCDISNPLLAKVVLAPSSVPRKLLLVTGQTAFIKQVTSLLQRNFINYALPANQGNYLIVSHPNLMTGPGGITPVDDYKTYRSSSIGGGFNAKVYMIDQIIDQFGFGIKQNPLGLRNFILWARNTFSAPIKNIFLIGRGLNYINARNNESNPDMEKLYFIPSFGHPASDMMLVAEPGLDETPKVPIGRLSVINATEIAAYFAKVISYEQAQAFSSPLIQDKAWMKNVVHAVGAGDGALQAILDIYMTKYKGIISDTLFGGKVSTFSKTTTDPVEQSASSRLKNLFQDGISLITYFGHSSATTLEYNLDNPEDYNNQGKYPLFLLLGCNAGNFFSFNTARLQAKITISEKYVLAPERGCIATFASTSLGIVHYLDIYNTGTYTGISRTKYGKTFGDIMIESIAQTYNVTTQNDFYARMECEQTTLHGDPALKVNAFPKPDYVIEPQLVRISPSFISVAETNFKVNASFMNIGKAINRPIVIEAKRTYPDLSTQIIRRDTIPGTRYMDSLSYTIPIVATRDKGNNKITITVDADNVVDELYESNNSVTKDFFIYEDEARPVYPYNFAIVNKQNIKLYASTANPFSSLKQYNMELDTTELFNSPLKVTRSVSSTGGVLEFLPGINFTDSTVYYWRVSPVPVSGAPVWNSASFIYIANGEPGFNQSHYFQQDKSGKQQILLDQQSRNWKFDSIQHFIFAKNGVFLTASTQEGDYVVAPDGSAYIRSACVGYSLIFNIFNPNTFKPRQNMTGQWGSYAPPCAISRSWNYEYSYMTPASRKLAMDMMDSIPDGYIVVVRNILNNLQTSGFINDWIADQTINGPGNTLYHKLKSVGFNQIDSFTSPRSFIYIYQKNRPSFIPASIVTQGMFDLVSITKNLKTPDTVGYITSPMFGRSKGWKLLKWKGSNAPDVTPGDDPKIDIIGVDLAGNEQIVLSGINSSQPEYDISSISATAFPYIKLRMRNADSINYTPYQMKYWQVTYTPVPEGAIAPNIFVKIKDTLDVGEPLDFKVAFKNVSEVPFDSLKIKMVITDRNNIPYIVPIPRKRPIPASGNVNDTLHLGALVNTAAIPGFNTMYIEANPDDDQPEQYHFNNFAFRNLYVKPDSLNPLLDVTFDGVHILNRDIVSSKPDIIVKLKDESRWMILDDTSLLTLQVRYPNGTLRRFYFNNTDTLLFTPAGQAPNPDNTATISFRPYLTEDGEYELIISGKDRSNNKAGNLEYRVIFEVINKPMISNMLNYPNPFTTSTAFVFTVTGTEVPQNIKIEIMTITGKIVREITKDELGPLHIGRNITEFKWDGTDQYGQKLANGIYLYRVVTNLNGKSLDKYKSANDNTDKYFNKGYGKMYLMR